jgi:1,4-alpha-glucan branching enzyme
VLVVCNFTPVVRRGWRVGVPCAGRWRERLNTDSAFYGGSNVGTPLGIAESQPVGCDGRSDSIVIELPPLATVMFEHLP